MRKYNFLQALFMSFYSPKLYRDVMNNWGGSVFLYLLFLIFICLCIATISIEPQLISSAKQISFNVVKQIPEMKIKQGKISTPENKPYEVKNSENTYTLLIVDTSGTYNDMRQLPKETIYLVTKDKIYFREDDNAIRAFDLPKDTDYKIQPMHLANKIVKIAEWGWVIYIPIMLMVLFFFRIIQALLYAILGKIYSWLAGIPISYATIYRLTLVAFTPVIIINLIFTLGHIYISRPLLLNFLITFIYIIFAIYANKFNYSRKEI